MPDRTDDYSYLETVDSDHRFGDRNISDRDMALVVALPDLDYNSQLVAIRALLDLHRGAEADHTAEIRKAEQFARTPVRIRSRDPFVAALEDDFREQNWIDHLHYSVYHDAAHSMAAVGLIAPFVESIFFQSFRSIQREMTERSLHPNEHERWQQSADDEWDCHYVWKNGRRRKDLVEGILQLVDAVDMSALMPHDLQTTLSALFAYRNKMFHCGFEWPLEERQRFDRQLSRWPTDWFSRATSGGAPWVFYMSSTFVTHCLNLTEQIIPGIGRFCKERFR